MYRPVLITAPELLPVSLDEAKRHLRVGHANDDVLIEGLIRAATDYLDGWTGILGQCLVEQIWRQDFDGLASRMSLPLGPVIEIVSVAYRDHSGDEQTLDGGGYRHQVDGGGRSCLKLLDVPPSCAALVTYKAGYPTIPEVPADGDSPAVPAMSTVPDAIKVAILLSVQSMYSMQQVGNVMVRAESVEGVGRTEFAVSDAAGAVIQRAAASLIAPYRRVGL